MPARKRLQTLLILMFFALVAVVGWAGAAGAVVDPVPTLTVSDRTPAQGSPITLCGSGFVPGESVLIHFIDIEQGGRVDANGDFCSTFPLLMDHNVLPPLGPRGLSALGEISGRIAFTDIDIVAAVGPPAANPTTGGELAFTGSTGGIVALAGVLLVAGVALTFAARRRKAVT